METVAGISVNVNARVEVTLSESGLRRINDYYDSLFPPGSSIRKFARLRQVEKLWRGQLWELMDIWGPEMYMGNPNHPLFEGNEIRFLHP